MHWMPVGASLFASNVGSGHFIGLAGAGAASGIAVSAFELGSVYTQFVLGWLFIPVYLSSEVYTMPEYLSKRFGGRRIRVYLSVLSLLLYIFTKISADLYAGALFMQLALNKSSEEWLYISILILLLIAGIFTIVGGLSAVVWTDFVQTILMVIGAFILMGVSLSAVGGYQDLVDGFPKAKASIQAVDLFNNTCGNPPDDYMHIFRTTEPGKTEYPWTGIFGIRLNSIWYRCADQVIVQRVLASKNMCHAKAGCILSGYLKFLPLWLLVIPGMAARVLYPNRVGCASPDACRAICGNPSGCSNIAYVELVLNLLPTGLCGLMLAVMMAALMTSLTSIFNSAATVFTIDVWTLARMRFSRRKVKTKPSETELLIVGKVFVLVLVLISVIWIPVIRSSGNSQLYHYIQRISSFLAPPICAVFILAVFWRRTNEKGAFWGLMLGLVVGMIRFILEFSYTIPYCGSGLPDPRPELIKAMVGNIHYSNFSLILWGMTAAVTVIVSLLTEPIPPENLYRLTFWTRKDPRIRKSHFGDYELPTDGAKIAANGIEASSESLGDEMVAEVPPLVQSKWRLILSRLCGVSGTKAETEGTELPKKTPEQLAQEAADFLYEPPFWRRVINCNAVVCFVLVTAIVIYYA